MLFGDKDNMDRGLRVNVAEGKYLVVLINDLRIYIFMYNFIFIEKLCFIYNSFCFIP